jgi:hypothetical protein
MLEQNSIDVDKIPEKELRSLTDRLPDNGHPISQSDGVVSDKTGSPPYWINLFSSIAVFTYGLNCAEAYRAARRLT